MPAPLSGGDHAIDQFLSTFDMLSIAGQFRSVLNSLQMDISDPRSLPIAAVTTLMLVSGMQFHQVMFVGQSLKQLPLEQLNDSFVFLDNATLIGLPEAGCEGSRLYDLQTLRHMDPEGKPPTITMAVWYLNPFTEYMTQHGKPPI